MGERAPVAYANLVCGNCGGRRFWDNGGKKRSGQWKPTAPDLTCARCRRGRWLADEGRERRQLTEPAPLPKKLPPVQKVKIPEGPGNTKTSPFFREQ